MKDYKTTVGIEVHCELKTNSKMFSNSINNYGGLANTNINEIDFALPGVLPTINEYGIILGIKAAIALNCEINKKVVFDRKNYYYPDLPKGYQITQARNPIGINGYVEINVDGITKKIRIHDIHLEEDTAKSTHSTNKSFLDFNRCSVPLLEIVTEADMASDKEAMAYLEKLRELLLYTDVSDCKMEEGSMRCDVNVSVSNTDKLGTRTETKNIGSISNVGKCILTETKRQIEELENGNTIHEETRRYDEKEDKTILMRVKETGNDYRYFPEPDLPEYNISDEMIENVKKNMEILPDARRNILKEANIIDINIEKIIANKEISDYLLGMNCNLVIASNLLLGLVMEYLNKNNISLKVSKLDKDKFVKLVDLINTNTLTNKDAKEIIPMLMEDNIDLDRVVEDKKKNDISEDDLRNIINTIVDNNPNSIKDYKDGLDRAVKYLMGQVMKETSGHANPQLAGKILVEVLESK